MAQARLAGKHVMVGAIDEDNVGSIEFHRRLGFVEVARMPEIGFKHGEWRDVGWWQLELRNCSGTPAPPLSLAEAQRLPEWPLP